MVIEVGDEPSAVNSETQTGLGGTRIFMPLRSSTELIGRLLVVMLR